MIAVVKRRSSLILIMLLGCAVYASIVTFFGVSQSWKASRILAENEDYVVVEGRIFDQAIDMAAEIFRAKRLVFITDGGIDRSQERVDVRTSR